MPISKILPQMPWNSTHCKFARLFHCHSIYVRVYNYYFPQELKHKTWMMVAMKITSVTAAIANRGAEYGARDNK